MSTAGPSEDPRLPEPLEWLFRDRRTGRFTVAQAPNLPLVVFAAAAVTRWLFEPVGSAGTVLQVVATTSLIWWAVDEILRGANPWRRLLGVVVLVAAGIGWAL